MPRNFAEAGAASSILGLQDDLGLGFVGDDQLEITPFQRQVYEAEKAREARAKEQKMEQARSGGPSSGRTPNAAYSGGGGNTRTERVRYHNDGESENPEANTSFVD